MSNDRLEASVALENGKLRFMGSAGSHPPIPFDYYPPLGDGQGYTGLEAFLTTLAACSGTTVLFLLRRMRKEISGFQVKAKGIRRDKPPTCFQQIFLEFVLQSKDVNDEDIQKAIKLTEESYCPVWAMIKNNVEVTTEYKIISS